jgi:hypothetical protein
MARAGFRRAHGRVWVAGMAEPAASAAMSPRGVRAEYSSDQPREKETESNPENPSQGHFQFP